MREKTDWCYPTDRPLGGESVGLSRRKHDAHNLGTRIPSSKVRGDGCGRLGVQSGQRAGAENSAVRAEHTARGRTHWRIRRRDECRGSSGARQRQCAVSGEEIRRCARAVPHRRAAGARRPGAVLRDLHGCGSDGQQTAPGLGAGRLTRPRNDSAGGPARPGRQCAQVAGRSLSFIATGTVGVQRAAGFPRYIPVPLKSKGEPMRPRTAIAAIATMTIGVAYAGNFAAAATRQPEPTGKAPYEENCRKCHGVRGIPPKAIKAKYPKIATFNEGFFDKRSGDSVVTILTKGKNQDMTSFKGKLSVAQMVAVAAYIRSFDEKAKK